MFQQDQSNRHKARCVSVTGDSCSEEMLNSIRRESELCDNLDGFLISHAFSDNKDLFSKLLSDISDEYHDQGQR